MDKSRQPPFPHISTKWGRSRRTIFICAAILLFLVVARLCAPFAIKYAINRRLNQIPGYTGQVDSINLNLWRGAYGIFGLRIARSGGRVSEPYIAAESIDFSIAWSEIFHGRLVSQIYMRNARLNFQRGPSAEESQLNADQRWQDVVNDLFPIDITLLDIKGGVLRFVDTTQNPRVDIAIHDLDVRATGLRNRPGSDVDRYPAKVHISGITIGGGHLGLYAKLEPLADQPHFELNLELKKVALPALNDFLKAYAGVTVTQGRFEVFFQMAMANGKYEGYVKPFFADLKFVDPPSRDPLSSRIWAKLVKIAASIAKNEATKQIATRIPFSGETGKLDVHTWKSIKNTLHHGFVNALSQGFEGTANPDGIKAGVPAGK